MLMLLTLCVAQCAASLAAAANDAAMPSEWNEYVVSEPCSNICILFASSACFAPRVSNSYATPTNFGSDRPISIAFATILTNKTFEGLRLAPEFSMRVRAFSESGKPVQPTRFGAKYGTKFEEFKGNAREAVDRYGIYYEGDRERQSSGSGRPYSTLARWDEDQLEFKSIFPPPSRLFNFGEPGYYRMQIEYQCLARPFPPTSTNLYLVRFRPVVLNVFKRDQ